MFEVSEGIATQELQSNAESAELARTSLQMIEPSLIDQIAQSRKDGNGLRNLFKRYFSRREVFTDIIDDEHFEHFRKEEGNVAKVAKKYNAYFVHSISNFPGTALNDLIEDYTHFGWREKVAFTLSLKPTTASSSIQVGRDPRTRSPFGVIYGSGTIEQAHRNDQRSVAISPTERLSDVVVPNSPTKYLKDVDDAISHEMDGMGGWNEIIIGDHPEVVGLFLSDSRKDIVTMDDYFDEPDCNYEAINKFAASLNLPVFIFDTNGLAHKAAFNSETSKFAQGEVVLPDKIINTTYIVPQEKDGELKAVVDKFLTKNEVPPENYD